MSAETELVAQLRADNAVAAIVGTKIYPYLQPQDKALPGVAYESSVEAIHTIHGGGAIAEDITLTCYCMATTLTAAEALGDAVRDAVTTAGSRMIMLSREGSEDAENEVFAAVLTLLYFD